MSEQPEEFLVEFKTLWAFDPSEWDDMTAESAVELAIEVLLAGDFNPFDGNFTVNGKVVEP